MILELYLRKRFTGVTVQEDNRSPGMWRIHKGLEISDMVNLIRAKDAAITWARPKGLGGSEVAHWNQRQTVHSLAYVELEGMSGTTLAKTI